MVRLSDLSFVNFLHITLMFYNKAKSTSTISIDLRHIVLVSLIN